MTTSLWRQNYWSRMRLPSAVAKDVAGFFRGTESAEGRRFRPALFPRHSRGRRQRWLAASHGLGDNSMGVVPKTSIGETT